MFGQTVCTSVKIVLGANIKIGIRLLDPRWKARTSATMKVYAVLLIAALCATAISAQEPEQQPGQSLRDKLIAKAKEIQAKLNQALEDAKIKGEEIASEISKALGEKKEQALARLQQLQDQLQAKLKELQEKAGPILDKAKQQAIEKAQAQIEEAIKQLQALKDKLSNAQ